MNTKSKKFVGMLASLRKKLPADAVGAFDDNLAQQIYDDEEAGQEFMLFLQNGARVQIDDFFRSTGKLTLTLQLPALPRLTLETLQEEYSWINDIECDNSPTEAMTLELGTVLRHDERSSIINDIEYERRLGAGSYFGFQQACWFVDHQDELELVAFKALCGKIYIDFPGLKVVDSVGSRYIPYLGSGVGRWCLSFRWLGLGFRGDGRVARPRK